MITRIENSCTNFEKTLTVTSRSVPAASPSLLGKFSACSVSFLVMWYLSS